MPEQANSEHLLPAPEEQEESRHVRAWRGRALGLVGAGFFIAVVMTLVTMSPYQAQAPAGGNAVESGVQDVLQFFPAPSTIRVANELLAALPRHDSSDAVVAHLQQHAEALFADFLVVFGSRAPRVGSAPTPQTPTPRRVFDDMKEHNLRLSVFRNSLAEVVKLNARTAAGNPSENRATFGITTLSDWTHTEFKSLLGLKGHGPSGNNLMGFTGTKREFIARMEKRKTKFDIPSPPAQPRCERNWAGEHPEIFRASQQGSCGSCWAHSVADELRAGYVANGGQDPGELSAEYLLDCQPNVDGQTCGAGAGGCCGGWPSSAMEWVMSSGGIPTKADYGPSPSNAEAIHIERCNVDVARRVTMTGYHRMHANEQEMASNLCQHGALGAAVWANAAWQYYTGGVLTPADCSEGLINHAVQVVGVHRGPNGGAWIIKNTWGPEWGVTPHTPFEHSSEAGFALLAFGLDTCQIGFEAVIPQGVTDATGETHGSTMTVTQQRNSRTDVCLNTCSWAGDGDCDDGGDGSSYGLCEFGTDCTDCGDRSGTVCTDTCSWSNDGDCDDGGSGASFSLCDVGTDCSDCGGVAAECSDSCTYAGDGDCDDGGEGSTYTLCEAGTDCSDCGARGGLCSSSCTYDGDGECDDGGDGSLYSLCDPGTDCSDCGPREGHVGLCLQSCSYNGDGDCDDGGDGSSYSLCSFGTDCADCGARSQ